MLGRRASAALLATALLALGTPARADEPDAQSPAPAPISVVVGFRVRGHTKVTERTLARLSHVDAGDPISADDIPVIEQALITSELFKTVVVTLEPAPGGVLVVATVDEKQSWIAAPTLYVLPGNLAFGAGFAENDLFGDDKKLLLYGQVGNVNTFFFGTYLDPAMYGTKLSLRVDLYLQRRIVDEYANVDPRSFEILRTTQQDYLDGGLLLGYTPVYWSTEDIRLRGAYVTFRDAHAPNGNALPRPEVDGRDISAIARTTLDARHHRFGSSWGPFAQLMGEVGIPGLSTYRYAVADARAAYAWTWLGGHELEVRAQGALGWHLPFDQELTMGGATDQRGYVFTQFRGDTRALGRVEYSVPIVRLGSFAFRGLGFWDSSYTGFHFTAGNTQRDYLPGQAGTGWWRNGVGGGLRLYVSSIVLPLLGFDIGYGLESHAPQFYFEVGLTDF